MIKIGNVSTYGFEEAIRGMRNPMNSWDKSDSLFANFGGDECHDICCNSRPMPEKMIDFDAEMLIGKEDYNLMSRLRANGTSDHRKYLRMIVVYADITAPLYWWKEFDTYKVGTVANSCSTMHKVMSKEFIPNDFSCERMDGFAYDILLTVIKELNENRKNFLACKDDTTEKRQYWDNVIQLLPSSHNQKRTVMLNYEVLINMYMSRKNHKLKEWRIFCDWINTLPLSELITGNKTEKDVKDFDYLM